MQRQHDLREGQAGVRWVTTGGDRVLSSCVLLAPYCLLGGALFTFLVHVLFERSGRNQISGIYSWEAIGSIIGGLLFNLIMVYFFTTFQTLKLLFLFNCTVAFLLAVREGLRTAKYCIPLLFLGMIILTAFVDIDALTKRLLFPAQKVLSYSDTPYGNITIGSILASSRAARSSAGASSAAAYVPM